MSDRDTEQNTQASPDPRPSKAHGDALLDQSGSRHGRPPERASDSKDEGVGEGDSPRGQEQ